MGFRIMGTGSAVPANAVSNDDIAKFVDTSDEWITQRTGIKNRYISTGETLNVLAKEASEKAMEMAGVSADSIDLIIVGTLSSDRIYPSAACELQAAIGAKNAIAFDINAACSGFLFALQIANGYFATGGAKRALLVGAEILSKMTDWTDRSTCVLFGDGAGACIVDYDKDAVVTFSSGSDGTKGDALSCKNRPINNPYVKAEEELDHTHMDGQEVFKFAVKTVPHAIEDAMAKAGVTAEDVDIFLLHQANLRIIESVAKRLKRPIDLFPMIMSEFGNMSAACVPILLDTQVRRGNLKRGMQTVMAGFGAGLTWSAAVFVF